MAKLNAPGVRHLAAGGSRTDWVADTFGAHECCHPLCANRPWGEAPFPICERHYAELIRHYHRYAQDATRQMRSGTGMSDQEWSEKLEARSKVYFIQFRDRVKIGTSTNIRRRVSELPYDRLIGTIPGGPKVEATWHRRFAHLRSAGEWFRMGPDLMEAIASSICSAEEPPRTQPVAPSGPEWVITAPGSACPAVGVESHSSPALP